jgi:hypothetical protein
VLAKSLADLTLAEFGGKLGNGISEGDRKFMETATGGKLDDPKALERILAIRAAAFINAVDRHNANVEDMASAPSNTEGAFTRKRFTVPVPGFSFQFQTPEAAASFEATKTGRPLAGTMDTVKKRMAAEGPKEDTETRMKKRMEELGLPYIPPRK